VLAHGRTGVRYPVQILGMTGEVPTLGRVVVLTLVPAAEPTPVRAVDFISVQAVVLIIMGKPPALPGDSKSLTFPAFGRGGTVLREKSCGAEKERQPDFSISSVKGFWAYRVLTASVGRLRLGPFEGPAIESPRLCRGIVTLAPVALAIQVRAIRRTINGTVHLRIASRREKGPGSIAIRPGVRFAAAFGRSGVIGQ